MKGLGIVTIFGFVALVLSYGIGIPPDMKVFCVISAAAAMAGYPTGLYFVKNCSSKVSVIATIGTALVSIISRPIFIPAADRTGE